MNAPEHISLYISECNFVAFLCVYTCYEQMRKVIVKQNSMTCSYPRIDHEHSREKSSKCSDVLIDEHANINKKEKIFFGCQCPAVGNIAMVFGTDRSLK